ncbi:phage tail family protein [Bacillus cereus]|nr:phage tail family protein [Bacillus cereus]
MSSFTFNNQRKDFVQIAKGWKRPTWAPLKRNLLQVPSYPGARLLSTETDIRVLSIPIGIIVPDGKDLEKLKEEIADWLITDQPCELIFDIEKDRTYMAIVDESFDPDEFVTLGQGVIKFICPMPYKLGAEQSVDFKYNNGQLIANISNKGTVESNPIFDVTVEKASTFFDIWNGYDYFRIGYPLSITEQPIERNKRVLWDDMSTTIGWTDVTASGDNTKGGGKFKSDGKRFTAESMGDVKVGWHGCLAKKNIPQGPFKDFIMESYVTVRSYVTEELGRVEVDLLDENGKYVTRILIGDFVYGSILNRAFCKIGDGNNKVVLINTKDKNPTFFKNFRGRFRVSRIGNKWQASVSKFREGTDVDNETVKITWIDENNIVPANIAQVQISICQFSENKWPSDMSIEDLKIWKVNDISQNSVPYIVNPGDKIIVDTERSLVTIDGRSSINIKDIFSDFPVINRGNNKLEIMPSDIGIAKVTYRERYR